MRGEREKKREREFIQSKPLNEVGAERDVHQLLLTDTYTHACALSLSLFRYRALRDVAEERGGLASTNCPGTNSEKFHLL
jgi:hypothetical protein